MTPEERAEALVKSPGLLFDDNAGKMRWNISVVRQAFRDCEEDCRRSWEKRMAEERDWPIERIEFLMKDMTYEWKEVVGVILEDFKARRKHLSSKGGQ